MHRRVAAPLLAGLVAIVLAGCSSAGSGGQGGTDQQGQGSGQSTASPSSTPSGPPPTFVPGGSADQNKAYFDRVLQDALAKDPKAGSHELVNALADAGFSKSDMQVTADRTSVDLEADYIIVSVKMGGQCLIGQRATSGYASEVAAPLSDGTCLIGETQPITW